MKKIFTLAMLIVAIKATAQLEGIKENKKIFTFKKENLFAGGAAGGGFGNGTFTVGLGPHIGYSLNDYVDVAASLNYNYVSIRDAFSLGDKLRQSIVGPGAFVRVFPVDFLYVQGQFERNFLTNKYIAPNNSYLPDLTDKISVNSYLVGGGYCSGRDGVGSTYFYFSILFDLGKDINSPYVDQLGRKDPVIRAGFNIALFNGGGSSNREARRSRRDD
jgi:hypothetical protein